jgi:ketosteroid isomerase-like protein
VAQATIVCGLRGLWPAGFVACGVCGLRVFSMNREIADNFIRALESLERDGDVESLMEIFAESCQIETPVIPRPVEGRAAARAFWAAYRMAFRYVHSTFRNIVVGDATIVLEWTALCVNRSGREFQYDGISILDISGPHITRFRSYFDSRRIREWTARAATIQ